MVLPLLIRWHHHIGQTVGISDPAIHTSKPGFTKYRARNSCISQNHHYHFPTLVWDRYGWSSPGPVLDSDGPACFARILSDSDNQRILN